MHKVTGKDGVVLYEGDDREAARKVYLSGARLVERADRGCVSWLVAGVLTLKFEGGSHA